MYLFLDSENRVKGVNNYKIAPDEANLRKVYVDEAREDFPFKNRSDTIICCYKVEVDVEESRITSCTPYINSNYFPLIEVVGRMITELNDKFEELTDAIVELSEVVYGEGGEENEESAE